MMPMTAAVRARIQYYGRKVWHTLFGLRVTGAERVPRKGGVIIACNHISELDPPVLGCAVPRTVAFMAKMELFGKRFSAYFLEKLNTFPVNRSGVDTGAIRLALDLLNRGEAVVIFPEGTRSRDGRLLPVKAGVGLVAASAGVPVLPAFIWGTDEAGPAFTRRGRNFSVTFGKIMPSETISMIKAERGGRAVAEEIMSAIEKTGREAGLYV